jgi:uncharacterized membrane protein
MCWLRPKRFARRVDRERIKGAIESAEGGTSGEIMVSVAPFFFGSVQRAAERAFVRLGVSRTRERNGVLIFMVPSRRQFVILGDQGIHRRVGQEFWEQVVHAASQRFKAGDFTGGLVDGIGEIGRRLAEHFPRSADDVNELPDEPDER